MISRHAKFDIYRKMWIMDEEHLCLNRKKLVNLE